MSQQFIIYPFIAGITSALLPHFMPYAPLALLLGFFIQFPLFYIGLRFGKKSLAIANAVGLLTTLVTLHLNEALILYFMLCLFLFLSIMLYFHEIAQKAKNGIQRIRFSSD
jgi:hypothetical protein